MSLILGLCFLIALLTSFHYYYESTHWQDCHQALQRRYQETETERQALESVQALRPPHYDVKPYLTDQEALLVWLLQDRLGFIEAPAHELDEIARSPGKYDIQIEHNDGLLVQVALKVNRSWTAQR